MGAHSPVYAGWSTHCSGRQYAAPKPKPAGKRIKKKGRATVTATALNVRDKPTTAGKLVALYKRGQSFNYDSYVDQGNIRWLSYVSWSGKRRYVAQRVGKNTYVRGGVMSINVPYRVRAVLYVLTALGTPVVAYLFAKGIIGDLEVTLWSAEVAVVSAIAAFNTVPTRGEKE